MWWVLHCKGYDAEMLILSEVEELLDKTNGCRL